MKIDQGTVLVVGGTSGIGRELAKRLRDAGSTVVVGGRSAAGQDGVDTVTIDVTDPDSVRRARDHVLATHPELETVIVTSGLMVTEDLRDPAHISDADRMIATNLLGTIRVVDAFTPHLIARGGGTLVTVSSGIAFLPFPLMPTYGATKAAVHSYTESLRAQLAGTGVVVSELVPPAVASGRMEKLNPSALPLPDFLDQVMPLLATDPTPAEIVVESARRLRWAERDGSYDELLQQRSAALSALPGR